jgi:hypothetical protein
MKVEKIVCDRCGSEGAMKIESRTGREMDPSGNGYVYDFGQVDLCHKCCSWAVEFMLDLTKDYDKVKRILSVFKDKRCSL